LLTHHISIEIDLLLHSTLQIFWQATLLQNVYPVLLLSCYFQGIILKSYSPGLYWSPCCLFIALSFYIHILIAISIRRKRSTIHLIKWWKV